MDREAALNRDDGVIALTTGLRKCHRVAAGGVAMFTHQLVSQSVPARRDGECVLRFEKGD